MKRNSNFNFSALMLSFAGLLLIGYALFLNSNASIIINWETATEFETAGYAIYRSDSPDGPFIKITTDLIPASTDPLTGGTYEYTDLNVLAGKTYYYQLEEIELSGNANIEGPIEVTAAFRGIAEGLLGLVLILFAWFTYRITSRPPEI